MNYEPAVFSKHLFEQKEQLVANKVQIIIKGNGTIVSPLYYINNLGYRGKAFDLQKKSKVKRIIVYGGSGVFDINAMLNEDWPHLLEKHLNEKGKDTFEVINAGIPGHASYDSLGKFFSEGHRFKPDFAILYNQWNDFKIFSSKEPLSRIVTPYKKEENPFIYYNNNLDKIFSHHSLLYLNLRTKYYQNKYKSGTEGILINKIQNFEIQQSALDQYRLNVELFIDCARNIGSIPILVTQLSLIRPHNVHKDTPPLFDYRLRHVENYLPYTSAEEAYLLTDKILREVSLQKGVQLIDAGNQIIEDEKKLFSDHVHLSYAGSDELARFISIQLSFIEKSF